MLMAMNAVSEMGHWAVSALLSTENDDGTYELVGAPIRWELGPMLEFTLPARGRSARNLAVRPDVVCNVRADGEPRPAAREDLAGWAEAVDVLWDEPSGVGWAEPSELVRPPRVADCPLQLEARKVAEAPAPDGTGLVIEAQVLRVHADPRLVLPLAGGRRAGLADWRAPVHDFRPAAAALAPRAAPVPAQELARRLARRFPGQRTGREDFP